MKNIIIITTLLFLLTSCTENYDSLKNNQDIVLNGVCIEYYNNGNIKSEINYRDGDKDGKYMFYFDNGNKWYEGSIQNGKEHGLWTEWHENGKYKEQGTFVKGLKTGFWFKWDKSGKEIDSKFYQTYNTKHRLLHDFSYRSFIMGPNDRLPEAHIKYMEGQPIFTQFVFHTDYKRHIIRRVTKEFRGNYTMLDVVDIEQFEDDPYGRRDSLLESIYVEYYADHKFSKIRKISNSNGHRLESNTYYYPNGKKCLERHYIDFKKNGIWQWWDEKGNIVQEVYCNKDVVYNINSNQALSDTLEFKYYYENIVYNRKVPFKNGIENGTESVYGNNILSSTWEYKNGMYNGYANYYYSNGNISSSTKYLNDTIHGRMITFYENGDTNMVLYYYKGQTTGNGYFYWNYGLLGGTFESINDSIQKITMFDETGALWQEIYKLNNLVDGEYVIYYPTENTVQYKIHFKKGNKQGKCEHFYSSGELMAEYNYRYDMLDGDFTQYHDNGQLKISGYWDNGAKSGLWKRFNSQGEILNQGEYADGILLHGDTVNTDYDFEIKNLTIF